MNLVSLFTRHETKLPPLGRELDAIKAGKKPFSFFASHRDFVEDGADLMPVMRAAFDRKLCVAIVPQPQWHAFVDIFVYRPGESQPVDRFRTFLYEQSAREWTFADEEKQSRLLGYSARERADWITKDRARYLQYNTRTVYAIVDRGRGRIQSGDRVFFDRAESGVYPSARSKLPKGTQLLRVGLELQRAKRFFGNQSTRLVEKTLTNARARTFSNAILAGPEVLGPRGWTRARR